VFNLLIDILNKENQERVYQICGSQIWYGFDFLENSNKAMNDLVHWKNKPIIIRVEI
jgi:hypothetical protein